MHNKSWKKMQFGGTSHIARAFQSILGFVFGYMFSTRAKKLIWLGILLLIIIMYYSSSKFILPHRHLQVTHGGHKKSPVCLESVLEPWYLKMERADAVIKHMPSDSVDHQFLPFIGNGYLGLTVEGAKDELFILNDTKIGVIKLPFSSIVQFRPMGETPDNDETIVLDMKNGEIHRFTTFNGDDKVYCIVVKHSIFIHREIPGLLVQTIKVDNFRPSPVHGNFDIKTSETGKKEIFMPKTRKKMDGFTKTEGIVLGEDNQETLVTMATSLFSKETKLEAAGSTTVEVKTIIKTADISFEKTDGDKKSVIEAKSKKLKKEIFKDWVSLNGRSLRKEHFAAWDIIWNLGIRIDSREDRDAPSSLNVNITEFYLYSMNSFRNDSLGLESKPGSCFYGSPTMHSAQFWVLPKDISSLVSLARLWNQTLFQFGCEDFLKAGVQGLQKALVLSFSGLQYTKHGLELAVNPISLSSNVSLRHLPYSENLIFIRIRITPPESIKTIEIFCETSNGPQLYACGSACEHVVEVGSAPSVFLAKITSPVTPILYVSTNITNLQIIKQSSFIISAVKEVQEDEQPRFAAHHFKLSAKFWAAVILSIVFFHVIVIKMIWTECRREKGNKRNRGRAFVS